MSLRYAPAPTLRTKELLIDEQSQYELEDRLPALRKTDPRPLPRVAIVGGSLGGCCAAIALAAAGCSVQVYERTSGELLSQGAGLVIQPDMAAFVQLYDICRIEDVSVASSGRQYMDRSGEVVEGDDNSQLFSAWDVMHRALTRKVPADRYHGGRAVRSVAANGSGAQVVLADGERLDVDLLVGADGPGSLVCSHFCPGVKSEYQGYLAWRGLTPESEVPPHVLDFVSTKFTVYQGPDFHILVYLIPGEGGEVAAGQRRVNWVWYWNHTAEEAAELLTDIHGRRHGYSIPRGRLRPEVAEARRQLAREVLPAVLSDLVAATRELFVQAIHDMLAPTLTFAGRCALVGDSGCVLRPHTAAGTTKAAVNAHTLARCLQDSGNHLEPALQRYNSEMRELALRWVEVGKLFGMRSQFPERITS